MAEKQKKYNTDEAIEFLLAPGSDSEMSDLAESDDEVEPNQNDLQERIKHINEDTDSDEEALIEFVKNKDRLELKVPDKSTENSDKVDKENANAVIPTPNIGTENEQNVKRVETQKEVHIYRWRKAEPPEINTEFTDSNFSLPPENAHMTTPLQYFELFWNPELNELIADQTNLYSVQKSGKSLKTTKQEIDQLLGIQMQMSILNLPAYSMYWARETRIPTIADIMPLNRYKMLRQYLHVSDNSKSDEEENKENKLFKIQPVLDHVRANCLKMEPEQAQSIDEQIIPAKTKYSGIRQYNSKKPVKWDFKNFVRSGASGMMYDFFLYTGSFKKDGKKSTVTGPAAVLKLVETLPQNHNFKVFFDNWFCNLSLCIQLKAMGFLATGTIRSDRMEKCPVSSDKDLKKQGRGSYEYRTDMSSGLVVVKWLDNKCVHMCTTYINPSLSSDVRRCDRKSKKYINVKCPKVVQEYNKNMGGVDLSDMLISLYRTHVKTKRWYLKVLCLDISKVNAWLLYRRFSTQLHVPKNKQLSLLKFIA